MALQAGCVGLDHPVIKAEVSPQQQSLIRTAILTIDDPDTQIGRLFNLTTGVGVGYHIGAPRLRQCLTEVFAVRITDGDEAALQHLVDLAEDARYGAPTALAVRLWSLLTLTPDRRYALLHEAWYRRENYDNAGQLFLALCLAEQGSTHPKAIDLIYTASPCTVLDGWRRTLQQHPYWRLEERPELAVAALSPVLGEATVGGWMTDRGKEIFQKVLHDVFTNKEGKFIFAVRKARALVDS